jgi:hypothetical protein
MREMAKPSLLAQSGRIVREVLPAVIKPIRTLWNEVIGFLFLALAALAVPSAFRLARNFNGDAESFFKLVLIGLFIVIMSGYGISSFRRARKISRG